MYWNDSCRIQLLNKVQNVLRKNVPAGVRVDDFPARRHELLLGLLPFRLLPITAPKRTKACSVRWHLAAKVPVNHGRAKEHHTLRWLGENFRQSDAIVIEKAMQFWQRFVRLRGSGLEPAPHLEE